MIDPAACDDPAQLFARQIQSRILSALSSSIVEAITGSAPGTASEGTSVRPMWASCSMMAKAEGVMNAPS